MKDASRYARFGRRMEAAAEAFAASLAAFFLAALVGLLLFAAAGCVGDGGRITEGTDLSVGVSLPGTDGEMSLTVFNWLSGFRLGVEEGSRITLRYRTAETNDYLGVIHTRTAKDITAEITPVLNEADADEEGKDADNLFVY